MQRTYLLLLLCGFLTACSTHTIRLQLHADKQLNWDSHHKSLPVVVRIYQLSDNRVFKRANFRELWLNDTEALGQSLLQRDEVTLSPNSRVQFSVSLHSSTRFIAGVALFREPKNNHWRLLQPVKQDFSHMFKPMTWVIQAYEIHFAS